MGAPIALFVYNRPAHTGRTVAALSANTLAPTSDLHIFSDGPKSAAEEQAVSRVREVANGARGFRSVTIHSAVRNRGLARSVVAGVTMLCESHGSIIVVEDDLITSPGFLGFMNDALTRYEADPRAMQISGFMFPCADAGLQEPGFVRLAATWGWATWQRAWKLYCDDPRELISSMKRRRLVNYLNMDGALNHFRTLQGVASGKIDAWGIRWYASMCLHGGLCLYPPETLVINIGLDGSGTNCKSTVAYSQPLAAKEFIEFPVGVDESAAHFQAIRRFYISHRIPLPLRAWRRIERVVTAGRRALS